MIPAQMIPVAGPWVTEKEVAYVADAAANAWYERAGEWYTRFENAFAAYLGRCYAVSLPSCTSGLHLALAALGIGPGDEVIVPDITWIASAAPITYVGATPVFADVDQDTWCLRPDSFEAAITPRTKAVIPVDLYGSMPDMAGLSAVANKHNVPIIEDSAEAVGSEYRGKRAGSFGLASVFSFHGSKTLTTGEGGLLATDDEAFFKRVLVLRDHGRRPGDQLFYNSEVAFKYKMSSLQAAFGLAQLERVEELIDRKRLIFDWYRRGLAGINGVRLNAEPSGTKNSYWMVTVILDPKFGWDKSRLQARLAERRIASRPFFHPLSSLPAYQGIAPPDAATRNPVSYAIHNYGLNLPSALNLTEEQVGYVCEELKRIL